MEKISVLMCVRNGQKHIGKSIESVLSQTFENFEFLILDDESKDETAEIIREYSKDKRIKVFKNEENLGLTRSLNKLLKLSRGEYVAIIDSDDIAKEKRLQKQISFMDEEKDIAMVASNCDVVDDNSVFLYTHCPPSNDTALRWSLTFRNPIRHSTVMIRRSCLFKTGMYDESFSCAQDYDMWQRMSSHFKIAVIPETLAEIRVHEKTISNKMINKQDEMVNLISRRQMQNHCKKTISLEEAKKIRTIYVHRHPLQLKEMENIDTKLFNNYLGLYFDIVLGFFNSGAEKETLISEVKLDIKSLIKTARMRQNWPREIMDGMKRWFGVQTKNEFVCDLEKSVFFSINKL